MVPVGTRQAREAYVTPSQSVPNVVTKKLFLAATDASLTGLVALLRQGAFFGRNEALWSDLVKFSQLRLPGVEDVFRNKGPEMEETGELLTWELVLHPRLREGGRIEPSATDEILEKLLVLASDLSGVVRTDYRRDVSGVTYLPAALTVTSAARLAAFNPLRTVRRMPRLRPIRAAAARGIGISDLLPGSNTEPLTATVVACFDGGVDPACPFIAPFVRYEELTSAAPDTASLEHGSLVTNCVLYGYPEPGTVPRPYAFVDHFRVWPPPASDAMDLDLYWVLDQIEERVKSLKYRMAVICMAPEYVLADDETPHVWTATLDHLAFETGTLFVVAAGNGGSGDESLELHRVQVPSDMVNGIGVGACTSRDRSRVLARAPYSSYGPGRLGARIQPIGLAFGGTDKLPFVGIGPRGVRITDYGTSFATPLAANGMLGLIATLGHEYEGMNTIRAAAAHFAERRKKGHKVLEMGYGRLRESYADVLSCAEHEVTVLYQGSLLRREITAFPLPLPTGIDPDARIEIQCTVGFTCAVDPADPVDYTLAGVEMTCRPNENRYAFRNPANDKTELLDDTLDAVRIAGLLDEGWRRSKRPVSDQLRRFGKEHDLREAGKWETLLQFRKKYSAGDLLHPEIELAYYARESGSLQRGPNVADLPFSMWVTITAPAGVALYKEAKAEYPVLTALRAQVRLQA